MAVVHLSPASQPHDRRGSPQTEIVAARPKTRRAPPFAGNSGNKVRHKVDPVDQVDGKQRPACDSTACADARLGPNRSPFPPRGLENRETPRNQPHSRSPLSDTDFPRQTRLSRTPLLAAPSATSFHQVRVRQCPAPAQA